MALYMRPESSLWYYEFRIAGRRYRGSTRTTDKAVAQAYEAGQRDKITQDAKQEAAKAKDAVQALRLWDVAQHWLTDSESRLQDHKGNLGRVRKLFGREMHLIGETWAEVDSQRYGLSRDTQVRDVTPNLMADLAAARNGEGASKGTIEREISLVRVLVAHAPLLLPKPVESVPLSSLELVIKGRRSLKKLAELARPRGSRRTPAERRELWRDVGVALLQGRAPRPTDRAFNEWCRVAGFDLDKRTREAAMWLAQNWDTTEHLSPGVWHPVTLRSRTNVHREMAGSVEEGVRGSLQVSNVA
ncbi:hypothetical protein [Variovorax sp. YR566]|uniref:hypothetical protein n=1 Tax=Variovorax sp. YR566 TaxID=3450237 RepID=UPI003F81E882